MSCAARLCFGVIILCYIVLFTPTPLFLVHICGVHDQYVPYYLAHYISKIYVILLCVGAVMLYIRIRCRALLYREVRKADYALSIFWKSLIRSIFGITLYVGGTYLLRLGMVGYFYTAALYILLLAEAKLSTREDSFGIAALEVKSLVGTFLTVVAARQINRAIVLIPPLVLAMLSLVRLFYIFSHTCGFHLHFF